MYLLAEGLGQVLQTMLSTVNFTLCNYCILLSQTLPHISIVLNSTRHFVLQKLYIVRGWGSGRGYFLFWCTAFLSPAYKEIVNTNLSQLFCPPLLLFWVIYSQFKYMLNLLILVVNLMSKYHRLRMETKVRQIKCSTTFIRVTHWL